MALNETEGDRLAVRHRELAERYGCSVDQLPLLKGMRGHSDCRPFEPNDRCGGCDECMWLQLAHLVRVRGRLMISIGIDQGRRSGWGIAEGRTVFAHGVATTHAERLAVLELARTRNMGTLRGVIVMFEDHSGIPLGRLTRYDHTTERRGRAGAPERSTASILGQGASKGRWLELLDMLEHPKTMRDHIKPHVWRGKLGISNKLGSAKAKAEALAFASAAVGETITDDDQAEGIGLTLVAAIDGRMRFELRKAEARKKARGARRAGSQGELFR